MTESYGAGEEIRYMVPDYYWESDLWTNFAMALGLEVDTLRRLLHFTPSDLLDAARAGTLPQGIEGLLAQWFVRTANEVGIKFWEEMLGLQQDVMHDIEVRRITVLNQLQNRGQSPTVQYINNLVEKYVNLSITQDQFSNPLLANYTFQIQVIDPPGAPPELIIMQQAVYSLRPSHMAFTIVYNELGADWVHIANRAWADIGGDAWNNLYF